MLQKCDASHVDHVPSEVIEYVLNKFSDKEGFFIETFVLPEEMPTLENSLYGPQCGDDPVKESDVYYEKRIGREWLSRLVKKPKRQTRTCTVIAGPHDEMNCVLYTVFGGPCSPKELDDPSLKPEGFDESLKFWYDHALSL